VTIGVSLQLPFWVKGDADVDVQLPTSPLYEKASVEGRTAQVEFTLPMVLRTGVEVRPRPNLRVELGLDWDRWSMTQSIKLHPKDIYILNLPSIDRYKVPDMENVFNFRDTVTLRLGGEYFFTRLPLVLRAGYIFELGAVQDRYASVMSMDSNKHVLTVGAGYSLAGYRLDLMLAQSFSGTRVVDYRESDSRQINPINPTSAAAIGGGTYKSSFTLLGLGLGKSF